MKIEGNTVMRFENLHLTVTPEAARLYDQACSGAIFCIIRISTIIDHFGLCRINTLLLGTNHSSSAPLEI